MEISVRIPACASTPASNSRTACSEEGRNVVVSAVNVTFGVMYKPDSPTIQLSMTSGEQN